MAWIPDKLRAIAEAAKNGQTSPPVTPRDLLSWFGGQRRGRTISSRIERALKEVGLKTEPDFDYAYIDGSIRFLPLTGDSPSTPPDSAAVEERPSVQLLVGAPAQDPTYRIGKLPSANTPPVSVTPNASLQEAVTLMVLNDFSQLPVIDGRTLKGAVTWQSIGMKMSLQRPCKTVADCLEETAVVNSDASLFAVIPFIIGKQYVLIRDSHNAICGIVTTTDLSLQFLQLAEPFLLLGEIENHLRRLSDGKFSASEVASVQDPSDKERQITDLSDLTFGEHLRLLEKPERWGALGLNIDRATFVKQLHEVREIRNNVMHFDPDGTAPSELEQLRSVVRLLSAIDPGGR
jgi:CBS domain-containing protein